MKSEYIKYGIYFILAALFVMLVQLYFPNPINWDKNFDTQNKDPYGLYIFNKELPQLLKNQEITKTALSPYEFFEDGKKINDAQTTFLLIENVRYFDPMSAKKVLEKVKNGADLVISNEYFNSGNGLVLDTLQLKIYNVLQSKIHFVNNNLAQDTLTIKDNYSNIFLVKKPENHLAIAKMNHELAFVATKFGKGTVYLNTTPVLLTNYYLLNKKEQSSSFTEGFASIIQKKNVVWFDPHYQSNERDNDESIFRVLFKHQTLRFAWYTLIFGLLLFIIFYGKRKQRIVPIIEPVKNTTVEYVETVGNLYYQENDITQLLNKQIQYALYFIRNDWKIPTQNLDNDFKERLQQKTVALTSEIDEFVHFVKSFNSNQTYTQQQLIQFNQLMEKLNINYGKFRK